MGDQGSARSEPLDSHHSPWSHSPRHTTLRGGKHDNRATSRGGADPSAGNWSLRADGEPGETGPMPNGGRSSSFLGRNGQRGLVMVRSSGFFSARVAIALGAVLLSTGL